MDGDRLLETTGDELRPLGVGGVAVHRAFGQLRAVLGRRLGARHAALLAEPHVSDGDTDWYSPAIGPVVRLGMLPPARRAAALDDLAGLLRDIEALAAALEREPATDGPRLAASLRLALHRPGDHLVFVVGDQPVIVGWGCEPDTALPSSFLPAVTDAPATAAAPASIDGLAAAGAAPAALLAPPPSAPASRRRLYAGGAVACLLVGVVAAGAWSLVAPPTTGRVVEARRAAEAPRVAATTARAPAGVAGALPSAPDVDDPSIALSVTLAAERERGRELGIELASLRERARRELEICAATPPAPPRSTAPPAMASAAPKPSAATPAPAAGALVLAAPAHRAAAAECPPPRRADAPPPDIVIVLDASDSMMAASGSPVAARDATAARERRGDRTADVKAKPAPPGARRIDDAKRAVARVVPRLGSDVAVGYISAAGCRGITAHGTFEAGQRDRLMALVDTTPTRGGTPLARAIDRAGAMLRADDGVIVVMTDGGDTCGGNVCAVAQRLHEARPGVRVHLIDLSGGAGEAMCLAGITGGRVLVATNAQAAQAALGIATTRPPAPAACQPAR
ncbi:MAG: VWA domain-containing protein [Rhodospirillales bacterium]|nr:MAG: VWA domain-containing protein [Rhodospirillales bacterium]